MNDKEIQDLERQGWIRFYSILEIAGKPKEHVETTLKGVVDAVKQDKTIKVINEDYSDSAEKEGIFTAFVELELLAKDFSSLSGFCFDFMPSSIEIISPETISFDSVHLSNLLNDLQTRLHKTDAVAKNLTAENEMVQFNISALMQNIIILSLRGSDKTFDQISKWTGMHKEHIKPILEFLVNKGIITESFDKFHLSEQFEKEANPDDN